MIIDASLVFSDAQAITTTGASDNNVDTLAAGDAYVGAWLVFRVDTAFTAAGSATLTIELRHDTASTFATDGVILTMGTTVAKATLVAGYQIKKRIPTGTLRYLRGYYTVASGPFTAGKADLFVAKDADLLLA